MGKIRFYKEFLVSHLQDFLRNTTLHGASHFTAKDRHRSEVIVWAVVLICAWTAAASIIASNYYRYYDNPVVISIEKNFRDWNFTLPAVTMCYVNRADANLTKEAIRRRWNVTDGSRKMEYYTRFVSAVAHFSADNLQVFHEFKGDSSLSDIDMEALAYEVQPALSYNFHLFREDVPLRLVPLLTDIGLCYTSGSAIAHRFSRENTIKRRSVIYCRYLQDMCYARFTDLGRDVMFAVHSPFELTLGDEDRWLLVKESEERSTTFKLTEVTPSWRLRSLGPSQRRCLYGYERRPAHSYGVCVAQCWARRANALCGCVPFVYTNIADSFKVCGVHGLICLEEKSELLERLNKKIKRCRCLPTCEILQYTLDTDEISSWPYPVPQTTSFRWAITSYSKTRYRRDIMFTFQDLLVSLGGTASLFLGCSLLSGVEIVYFLTIRLVRRYIEYHATNKYLQSHKKNQCQRFYVKRIRPSYD